MPNFSDLPSLFAFHCCHVSLQQAIALEQFFGSLSAAWQAGEGALAASQVLKPAQLERLSAATLAAEIDAACEWGEQEGQHWLPYGSADYPASLQAIDDAPLVLSVRGQVALLSDPQLAIVGSRHASKQGMAIAKDFAQHLSTQGLSITSGLALGIDTAAHQGGLQGIGKTVAIVATGLDRIYPASNQSLGRQIAEEGAMVSEFPLGTKPLAHHFPKRNRIISGLSAGTLVVEAALKSGSLITAKTAMEQGREVFAIPGSIYNPQSKGCHQLIKQGAKLVESAQDIWEELSEVISLQPQQVELPITDAMGEDFKIPKSPLLTHISYEPISLDELVVLTKLPASEIQAQLMMLELSGDIESMSAGRWRRFHA